MTTYTPTETDVQSTAEEKTKSKRVAKAYINPYLAAILLGLVLFMAFFLTGSGLGASGGLNRLLVFFEDLVVPGHIDRTPYLITMAGGDRNPLDSWIVFLTLGTVLGGFVSGLIHYRVKLETNRGLVEPLRLMSLIPRRLNHPIVEADAMLHGVERLELGIGWQS